MVVVVIVEEEQPTREEGAATAVFAGLVLRIAALQRNKNVETSTQGNSLGGNNNTADQRENNILKPQVIFTGTFELQ